MNRKSFFILFFLLLTASLSHADSPTKVACIGNSITYGIGTENPQVESYPAQLQQLLGCDYLVGNFGKPGATLLNHGHRPYMKQPEFQKAMEFAGDIAVIHLGINDTDPRNWPNYRDEFVRDYLALIDSCRKANPHCRILICRLTPISHRHPRFESGTRDWHRDIQQAIETISRVANVQLIDLHQALYAYPLFFPDGLHPNPEGAGILAHTVYSAITGDFGGLHLPQTFTDYMVLQRNRPLTIEGTANAGEKVTVCIDGQQHTATTGYNGKWSVTLHPIKAGNNYELTVSTHKQKQTFHHVAAGEVWLCSGQSNMEFQLSQAITADKDIPIADNTDIRLYHLKGKWATDNRAWEVSALDSVNHLLYYQPTQWKPCTPQQVAGFSAVAYYFGKMIQDSLNVPVGLICNAVGGSPTEAWIDRSTLEFQFPAILRDWTQNDFIQDWVRERALTNLQKKTDKLQRHPYEPCYLYETGIQTLEQYPIKGVIWYQGESNAHNMEAHEKLFSLLVQSWRRNWQSPELPFYFVQLSSLNRPSWPWFRDSQRQLMQQIPHTGMAVSSDKGDSLDVHPRNKRPIGERLARWALHKEYGFSNLLPSGPLFKSAQVEGKQVVVDFLYGKGLQPSNGKEIIGFEIAETDGLYYPAKATIQGERIILHSPQVKTPHFIRYGWQPFTRANLMNAEGLPASTFREEIF